LIETTYTAEKSLKQNNEVLAWFKKVTGNTYQPSVRQYTIASKQSNILQTVTFFHWSNQRFSSMMTASFCY